MSVESPSLVALGVTKKEEDDTDSKTISKPIDLADSYTSGERILAFHGPLIYDAKIMGIRQTKGDAPMTEYLVHYLGWKKSWDEWMDGTRIMPDTARNRVYQQTLALSKKGTGEVVTGEIKSGELEDEDTADENPEEPEAKRTKTKESSVPKEKLSPIVEIPMPEKLRQQLVSDWKCVMDDQKMFVLPARVPIIQICRTFMDYCNSKGEKMDDLLAYVVSLRKFFDLAVGKHLLYALERRQYMIIRAEMEKSGKTPSEVYGPDHLLRLFAKLPDLLPHTDVTEEEVAKIQRHTFEFMRFLALPRYFHHFFSRNYLRADSSAIYQRPPGS